MTSRIFISYSRRDDDFIDDFAGHLRAALPDVTLWYDQGGARGFDGLAPGTDWWQSILDNVAACDLFVFLMSNEAVESIYCVSELLEALRLGKQVIPVEIRATDIERAPYWLRPFLARVQKTVLTGRDRRDSGRLLTLVGDVQRALRRAQTGTPMALAAETVAAANIDPAYPTPLPSTMPTLRQPRPGGPAQPGYPIPQPVPPLPRVDDDATRRRWFGGALVIVLVLGVGSALYTQVNRALRPSATESGGDVPALLDEDAPRITPDLTTVNPANGLSVGIVRTDDVADEYLYITNVGETQDIVGWEIRDEDGNAYVFLEGVLLTDAELRLYSGEGEDDYLTYYWGEREPVWEQGETLTLTDALGTVLVTTRAP